MRKLWYHRCPVEGGLCVVHGLFSSHPAPRNCLDQGRWGDSGGTEQASCRSSISTDKPGPAAEQRQVWSTRPSLGPWHPPLRSTHRVGSVGQVRTGKINGAGAGLGGGSHLAGQGPPWRLSAQHRPRTKADVIQPGSDWPQGGLGPALLPLLPILFPVPCLSWPQLASLSL